LSFVQRTHRVNVCAADGHDSSLDHQGRKDIGKRLPEWIKAAVDRWTLAAGINAGSLFRSINKAGKIWGDGFTPKGIWVIVKVNAKSCGLPRWHRTICGVPVHGYATRQAAN